MEKKEREAVSENSRFIILGSDGQETLISRDSYESLIPGQDNPLSCILRTEFGEAIGVEVPSIKAMQALELVDYEVASDSGHFRFYPKGYLVYELVHAWAEQIAEQMRCLKIKTPMLYSWDHPAIRSQGESFHERHYSVFGTDKEKEFVLRFAGDFGLFSMISSAHITYKQLPLRIYEFSDSFRYEQRGELSGLRRLRAFSMPDIHSFCLDVEQGLAEYQILFRNYADQINKSGIEYGVVFRVVEEFYLENKDLICGLLEYCGHPALIEILPEMKHYWAMKHEFCSIDSIGGICQLSTVQLDVEDAERYGINYHDNANGVKGCIICHSSIGSIERWLFSILEDALKKPKPSLPLWLSPVQVRLVPVSDEYVSKAEDLQTVLASRKIRADIDDRTNGVSWKIRQAEKDWIPNIIVVGAKESMESLSIRLRSGEQITASCYEFMDRVKLEMEGFPTLPLFYKKVSECPIFRGGS